MPQGFFERGATWPTSEIAIRTVQPVWPGHGNSFDVRFYTFLKLKGFFMDALRIKEAASKAGVPLTDEQIEHLSRGEPVLLGGCNGVKIIDLGGGCALYWNPPFGVSVCCQT